MKKKVLVGLANCIFLFGVVEIANALLINLTQIDINNQLDLSCYGESVSSTTSPYASTSVSSTDGLDTWWISGSIGQEFIVNNELGAEGSLANATISMNASVTMSGNNVQHVTSYSGRTEGWYQLVIDSEPEITGNIFADISIDAGMSIPGETPSSYLAELYDEYGSLIFSYYRPQNTGSYYQLWEETVSLNTEHQYSLHVIHNMFDGDMEGALHNATFSLTVAHTPVPEPATMLLFATGLVGLVGRNFRNGK